MKDRTENMYKSLCTDIEENFALVCQKVQKIYHTEWESIWLEIYSKFKELFLKTMELQQNGEKETIKCVYIQFLHSSLNTGQWGYRLESFDEQFYLCKEEASVYYYPEYLYPLWEKDIDIWIQKSRRLYPRIQMYEIEEIRNKYIEYYGLICRQLFTELAVPLFNISEWQQVKHEERVALLFGGYMEKGSIIYLNVEEKYNDY